jgi:hypothetical protein
MSKVEAGQIQVRLAEESRNGSGRVRRRASGVASGSAAVLIVCVAGLAAGTVLALNQLIVPGWFCLGLAALAAASLLFRR